MLKYLNTLALPVYIKNLQITNLDISNLFNIQASPAIFLSVEYNTLFYYYLSISLSTIIIWSIIFNLIIKGYLGTKLYLKIQKLQSQSNKLSLIIILKSLIIIYLIFIYLMNNIIYLDNMENIILYNNIYIKGLNSIVNNYSELIAYAVGVKLSSIYLKILPTEPVFYFYFGLGVGPSLTLTVNKEELNTIGISNNKPESVLLNIQEADSHVEFLKDMVPKNYQEFHITKMSNFDNNTAIISGDAPNIINSPLEFNEIFSNSLLFKVKFIDWLCQSNDLIIKIIYFFFIIFISFKIFNLLFNLLINFFKK
jgi:hypothetical protein